MNFSFIVFTIFCLACIESARIEDVSKNGLHSGREVDCSEIGSVRYVQIFEAGETLVVVWQEPEAVEACNLETILYYVAYDGYTELQEYVTQELHYNFVLDANICTPGKISITPYNELLGNGTEYSTYYSMDIPSVEDIAARQEDDTIQISWSPPSSAQNCSLTYTVTYIDTNNSFTVTTDELTVTMDNMNLIPCVTGEISIELSLDNIVGPIAYHTITIDVGPVTNYYLESIDGQIITNFDPPINSEQCDLTYQVIETDLGCYKRLIEVLAEESVGGSSEIVSSEIETEIPAVESLQAYVEDNLLVGSWDASFEADKCGISYWIQYDNENVYNENTTVNNFTIDVPFVPCQEAIVEVRPISSTGHLGLPSSVSIEAPLGVVQSLSFGVTDGRLVASWVPPENSDACKLTYLLTLYENENVHVYITPDENYSFDYCTKAELVINAISDGGLTGPNLNIENEGLGCPVSYNTEDS